MVFFRTGSHAEPEPTPGLEPGTPSLRVPYAEGELAQTRLVRSIWVAFSEVGIAECGTYFGTWTEGLFAGERIPGARFRRLSLVRPARPVRRSGGQSVTPD